LFELPLCEPAGELGQGFMLVLQAG